MHSENNIHLSICIPTYNRLNCLENCLESIKVAKNNFDFNFEVCISDNNPEGNAYSIVSKYTKYLKIKYIVNDKNIGIGKNIFNSVNSAEGEYSWIIGNDDMLVPYTFNILSKIFNENKDVDFFYINSFSINSKLILGNKRTFNFYKIQKKLTKFSNVKESKKVNFFDLIDHKTSWDFMLGIFLSIFRTKKWHKNKHKIDLEKINDSNFYTNQYNTFPHLIIFANAFKNSQAYIQHEPLSINLIGEREWANLFPLIEAVRIPQVLDLYRKNGLPLFQYLIQKNFALRKLFPGILKMIFFKKHNGLKHINFTNDILKNLYFPGVYIYGLYFSIYGLIKIILRKDSLFK